MTPAESDLAWEAVRFLEGLRRRGLPIGTNQSSRFVRAMTLDDRASLRDVAVATLATSPDHVAIIEELTRDDEVGSSGAIQHGMDRRAISSDFGDPASDSRSGDSARSNFSAIEVLRRRDVAVCSDEERAEIRRRLAHLTLEGEPRRSRRRCSSTSRGALDIRETVRAASRVEGELMQLARRAPRRRGRRLVFLLDVSGSMEPYARVMLQLAHAGVVGRGDVEVFALGTRLTRLTRRLSSRDPDAAFAAAVDAAPDWGGGTRLGSMFRAINDDPAARGLVRGATVVVVSDGLDRGDPAELGEHMARLARVAHRTIWVNPLHASPGYEPKAAGMQAALPHVDEFVPGHCLEALEELAALVSQPPVRRG